MAKGEKAMKQFKTLCLPGNNLNPINQETVYFDNETAPIVMREATRLLDFSNSDTQDKATQEQVILDFMTRYEGGCVNELDGYF
jgi:hypothetical protein